MMRRTITIEQSSVKDSELEQENIELNEDLENMETKYKALEKKMLKIQQESNLIRYKNECLLEMVSSRVYYVTLSNIIYAALYK